MSYTSKIDNIDLDEFFGKAKSDIKAMDSKLQTVVQDYSSKIGSFLDEYFGNRYNEIINLKPDESISINFTIGHFDVDTLCIWSINDFALTCEVDSGKLVFTFSRDYNIDIKLSDLVGESAALKGKTRLKKRLKAYFSNIPSFADAHVFDDFVFITTDVTDGSTIARKFESDMNKFLNVYFDKRKIKATVHGNEIQIYGFSNDE